MDTYSLFREIADSWVLLGLFGFFIGAVLFAFRPGSRETHRDTSQIPFRHDDAPVCDRCDCAATDFLKGETQ